MAERYLIERADATPSMFINDIAKMFGKMANSDLPTAKLSLGYRRMYRMLCLKDGITQVELAKLTGISSPSVSSALNKMEADGLIRRVPDDKDRRKVFVYITELGREQDQLIRNRCRELEEVMLKGLSPEEIKAATDLLRRMLTNLVEEAGL